MGKHVEILAPAGSLDSLRAGLAAGADAVYIGGSRFGARAYAQNFTEEQLLEAIDEVQAFILLFFAGRMRRCAGSFHIHGDHSLASWLKAGWDCDRIRSGKQERTWKHICQKKIRE